MKSIEAPVLIVGGGAEAIGLARDDGRERNLAALRDPRCAPLVRADRFVAWRSLDAAADPAADLRRAFERLLDRTIPS
jgi:hypothetical protein